MRTPEQMMHDINNLNCHAPGAAYGPVTVAQMEAIYTEARKVQFTSTKPNAWGWWWYKTGDILPFIMQVIEGGNGFVALCEGKAYQLEKCSGLWSTRPIDMPEDGK